MWFTPYHLCFFIYIYMPIFGIHIWKKWSILSIGWVVFTYDSSWRRHKMEPFSPLQAFCAGNSTVAGEVPAHRLVTRNSDVLFDLCLNQQLSKQWRRRWFETPSHSIRHYCNVNIYWCHSIHKWLSPVSSCLCVYSVFFCLFKEVCQERALDWFPFIWYNSHHDCIIYVLLCMERNI